MLWCDYYDKPCEDCRNECVNENMEDDEFCECEVCSGSYNKNPLGMDVFVGKSEVSDILTALYVACKCLDNFKDSPSYVCAKSILEQFGYEIECTAEENSFISNDSRKFTIE